MIFSAKDDAKIELKIDMVTWRREMEKQKLTRIKKVKINKQASAVTTAAASSDTASSEQSKSLIWIIWKFLKFKEMEICSNTDDSNSIKRAWNDVRELNSNEYKTLEAESMDILRDLI